MQMRSIGMTRKKNAVRAILQVDAIIIFIAPIQVVLSTYAWVIANFGESSIMTIYGSFILREYGWLLRYYVAILIVAGTLFVPFASRKVIKLVNQIESKD